MINRWYKGITNAKIAVNNPANQDATTVLITCYGKDAEGNDVQYYAKAFDWQQYHGFDMLDVGAVTFPGWVQVRMSGSITANVSRPTSVSQAFGVDRTD